MAGHGCVPQHGFGPGRGHHHIPGLPRLGFDDRITHVPEVALHFFIDDLVIGYRGLELAVPVDQAVSAVDQAVPEQAEKSLPDSSGTYRIHGKAGPLPVAGAAHLLELLDDPLLIFVFPGPDFFHQGLAADIMPGFAFQLEKTLFHNRLGGDPGVICSRHPERVVPHHAVPSRSAGPA